MKITMLLQLSIASILINNLVFSRLIGLCPCFGKNTKLLKSLKIGLFVTCIMFISSVACWFLKSYILIPLSIEYMQTITFVVTLIITYLIIEIIVYNFWKKTHEKLSIYLKSLTTNCAILGVLLINSQINPFTNQPFSLLENMVSSISNGIGFTIALLLITGVQKRLQFSQIPKPLQNIPVAFLSAGLISMVLLGFSNINFSMLFGG